MVSLPREFRASLESYNGPLDLLLFLIRRDEVDVFDIPISRLVDQYQVYLEILREVDPNACGEFLVMAARLMEIKSKLLLPREVLEEGEEELEDPRIELVRQLLEYKKFKERALLLENRLASHRKRHRRPRLDVPSADEDNAPLNLGSIGVWDLLTAFHRVQIALGARVPHQVVIEERPLEEYMAEVAATLGAAPEMTAPFTTLFENARSRVEAVSYFLAILQLAKDYRLEITQPTPADEIRVRLRTDEETEALREAERVAEAAAVAREAERAAVSEDEEEEYDGPTRLEPDDEPGAEEGDELDVLRRRWRDATDPDDERDDPLDEDLDDEPEHGEEDGDEDGDDGRRDDLDSPGDIL